MNKFNIELVINTDHRFYLNVIEHYHFAKNKIYYLRMLDKQYGISIFKHNK